LSLHGDQATCLVLERDALEGLGNPALAARLVEAAQLQRSMQRAKGRARRASTTMEGAAAAAADLAGAAVSAELQRQAAAVGAGTAQSGLAAGLAAAGAVVGAGSSSVPRAARRLSVGQGMQAELPEDLSLRDLEVRPSGTFFNLH
jgi:hypothetical protein